MGVFAQKLQLSQPQKHQIGVWRSSVHAHMQRVQMERHSVLTEVIPLTLCNDVDVGRDSWIQAVTGKQSSLVMKPTLRSSFLSEQVVSTRCPEPMLRIPCRQHISVVEHVFRIPRVPP